VNERRARVASLDVMRGLVMVVMALDHVRDFWSSAQIDPTDAAHTTPALFATRWVTHLCAPWFMLLAGAGAYLAHRDRTAQTRFLVTRGVWLIVLELTIVKLCWEGPDTSWTWFRLLVLWALGVSMIALAALQRLPMKALIALAVAMIVGHDLLDRIDPDALGPFAGAWRVLHVPGPLGARPGEGLGGFVLYPLVPWIGVMALGYAFGAWVETPALRDDPRRRSRTFAVAGAAMLALFVAIRAFDVYGDPSPWSHQATAARTVMSFLELSKYPPSLDYLLATIGVGLLVLAALEHLRDPIAQVLRVYGRVPLFYYVLHLFVIATSALIGFVVSTGAWPDHASHSGWGYDLPVVYLVWALVVIALYVPCRWFAGVKQRRRDWWLGYL